MATIRPIEPQDEKRWRELFTDFGVFYDTEFTTEVLDGVWGWLLNPEHPVGCFVAVDEDDELIGFALHREQPDTFSAGTSYCLDDLYVDPAARGARVAGDLVNAVEEMAQERGAVHMRWITGEDNYTARKSYDRITPKSDWVTYEQKF